MHRAVVGVIGCVLVLASIAAPASAETLTWRFRSDFAYKLYLEFYSQDYDRAWPGDGQVYVIADYEFHTYNLACSPGELICYGAWTDTGQTFWGSGWNGRHSCDDCCTTCGNEPGPVIFK